MPVTIRTFGYHDAVASVDTHPPADATLILDCRDLPNSDTRTAAARTLIDTGVSHGRQYPDAVIYVGCGFGQQRSVAIAAAIRAQLDGAVGTQRPSGSI